MGIGDLLTVVGAGAANGFAKMAVHVEAFRIRCHAAVKPPKK